MYLLESGEVASCLLTSTQYIVAYTCTCISTNVEGNDKDVCYLYIYRLLRVVIVHTQASETRTFGQTSKLQKKLYLIIKHRITRFKVCVS